MNWTAANIPSQDGKIAIVTGANSGLGEETSRVLAQKGAYVVMAVRSIAKGQAAKARIVAQQPNAKLELMQLDLSDLDSVKAFAAAYQSAHHKLDILVNNAGVMQTATRELTKQGFEMQFGVNHLAHFALTAALLPVLKATPNARVVSLSSIYHKIGAAIHFDDLMWARRYDKAKAYAQSKLANLLFAYELDRKLKANGLEIISTAAHPGYTKTNLQRHLGFTGLIGNALVAQSIEMGTLPSLRAATEPGLAGGEFFGPTKLGELRGYPEKVASSSMSNDKQLAEKLWQVSEELTGTSFAF